jgi:hypothetical protein
VNQPYRETPNVPCSKSHTYFPWPRLFQTIRPNPSSCLALRNKPFFLTDRSSPLAQHISCRTIPCRPSATIYSIYSQLLSSSLSRLLHLQPEYVPWCFDRNPRNKNTHTHTHTHIYILTHITVQGYNFYPSRNIFRVIKSRRMRWFVHKASVEEMRNEYKILVGKTL